MSILPKRVTARQNSTGENVGVSVSVYLSSNCYSVCLSVCLTYLFVCLTFISLPLSLFCVRKDAKERRYAFIFMKSDKITIV